MLGRDLLEGFFAATENPFIGLMVGILATTLVQSSSVTTSMIVGLVAAPENPLPLANAVPMVMGANIGTTATNTIVALAHMGRRGGVSPSLRGCDLPRLLQLHERRDLGSVGADDGLPARGGRPS